MEEKHWLDFLPKNQNSFLKRTVFWSPAFQTRNMTPKTNYKNRNHTDISPSTTTSTPRVLGPCCLHNSSLLLYPRWCCFHVLQISNSREEERTEGAYRCKRLRTSTLAPCSPGRTGVLQLLQMYFQSLWKDASLQCRTSGLGLERNKMLN